MIAVRVLYNDAILDRSSRTDATFPGVRMSTSTTAEINDMDGMPAYCRMKAHYQAGDPLLEVLQFETDVTDWETKAAHHAADVAFTLLNVNHPEGWAHRSMCVGDIVVVGEVALVCASFGWEFVDISASEVKVG